MQRIRCGPELPVYPHCFPYVEHRLYRPIAAHRSSMRSSSLQRTRTSLDLHSKYIGNLLRDIQGWSARSRRITEEAKAGGYRTGVETRQAPTETKRLLSSNMLARCCGTSEESQSACGDRREWRQEKLVREAQIMTIGQQKIRLPPLMRSLEVPRLVRNNRSEPKTIEPAKHDVRQPRS